MAYARIAITLPKELLASLDRRAKDLDRSRSGVIVDAIRAYLAIPVPVPSAVREPFAPAYGADPFGQARRDQLEHDLAKSPAERLQWIEEAAQLARQVRPPRGRRNQIIAFDSFEDFWEWKRASRA